MINRYLIPWYAYIGTILYSKIVMLVILLFLTYISYAFNFSQVFRGSGLHPDVGLNVEQLITKYGYPFENHSVTTEDGYILGVHRIPYSGSNVGNEKKGVVLLMHALFCSSANFVNLGPNSLAFVLADNGYDVWLGNNRGNTWSRKHIHLDPDDDKKTFWNFSVHELGYYDLSAITDYVVAATGQNKIFYAGHSQALSVFCILTSTRPEYNSDFRFTIALSPAIYINHTTGFVGNFYRIFEGPLRIFFETAQIYEILRNGPFIPFISRVFCNDYSPIQILCAYTLLIVAGFSENQLDRSSIAVIASTTPAGASSVQLIHFAQFFAKGHFRQMDHGIKENLNKYGSSVPPPYYLNRTTVPVAIYYGDKDVLSVPVDIERIAKELPNIVVKKLIKGFNHLDVLWGKDANELVFKDMLKLMENF